MVLRAHNVYGIGNAIMDLQLSVDEEVLSVFGLEKAAMKLVDQEFQARLIEGLSEHSIHHASGGSAANTMFAVSQLGGSAAFGCLVGDDKFGKKYLEELTENKINHIENSVRGGVTGTCVVLITPDAERTLNTHLGISAEFGPEHVSEKLIKDSEWLYIEGYLLAAESGQRAAEKAIEYANKFDTKVALTLSDGFIVDVFSDALSRIIPSVDLLFANLNEGRKFTKESEEERVFEKLCKTIPNVCLTLSERGSRVSYADEQSFIEPFEVKAIDDTGAGDMFAGGFLWGITNRLNGEKSGRLASYLASRVVSKLGPRLEGDLVDIAKKAGVLK